MNKQMKKTIKKAASVYSYLKEVETEDVNDELFLWVANVHLEKTGELPEQWLEYLQSKLGGNDENTSD